MRVLLPAILCTLTLTAVGIIALVVISQRVTAPKTGLAAAAAALLGLNAHRGAYAGRHRGHWVTITPLPPRDQKTGLYLQVELPEPLPGELRFSGPSPNAGSGTPEVKLRIYDGPFDEHFWIKKSSPPQFAADLLLPHDAVRDQMLAVPFGQWTFSGKEATYQSYQINETNLADVRVVLDLLIDISDGS